jgi:hypothetical protein
MRLWLTALLLAGCARSTATTGALDAGPDAAQEADAGEDAVELAADSSSDTGETAREVRPDPSVIFDPTTEMFVAQVGATSTPHRFTLGNFGDAPGGPAQASLGGVDAADFVITRNDCAAPLPGGGSCSIEVVFKPRAAGSKHATLTVAIPFVAMAVATLYGQALTGDGFALSPSAVDFGMVKVGATGTPAAWVIRSTGSAAVTLAAVTVSSAEFVPVADTCSGATLVPGGMCTFQVAFRPTTLGQKSGLVLVDAGAAGRAAAALTGTGF